MRYFFPITVLLLVGGPAGAEEPKAESKRSRSQIKHYSFDPPNGVEEAESKRIDVLRRAATTHAEVMRYAQEVLKNIPENAKTLTEEQYLAVQAMGLFKYHYAMKDLKKIVLVKYQPKPNIYLPSRPRISSAEFTGIGIDLDPYPAAKALRRIGWPAARSIVSDFNSSKGKMDSKRLDIYANILCDILMEHTDSFLREERSHAPPSAVKLYDKILAMPVVETVCPKLKWRHSEPKDAKLKKKTRPAKKDRLPIKKTQEKLSVEHPAEHLVRVWTDITGKNTVEARLVELKQGKVHLKKADGETISLPLSQLSKADQEYVKKTLPESFPQKPTPKKPTPKKPVPKKPTSK